jgi:hypothetical protein
VPIDVTQIRDWAQLILSISTLVAIIWGAFKVVGLAEKKVEELDRRVLSLEDQHESLEKNTMQVATLSGKLDAMTLEIERVRSRLDRFLDFKKESGN